MSNDEQIVIQAILWLCGIGFGIFVFALLVRLWDVLRVIRETCWIIQRIAKEKYPEEQSDVQESEKSSIDLGPFI